MSRKRLGRLQRAATIVPLALLSIAWTAGVYGIGGVTSPVSAGADEPITEGISVPADDLDDPASVTNPGSVQGTDGTISTVASTNEIPSSALAAYQRAETVINSADKSCHLTWQLIAAIGRVESNHGRSGGNVLDSDGVARPGIYGMPLNGSRSTISISDTDAGQLDDDTRWDRAIGPMQFIPATWQVVGVDADNDDERNPQDIDDAALATAVYLCSGDDDLSTLTGQRAAVYRYNHSQQYVDLVLSVMEDYLEGDFTAIPDNTIAGGYLVPDLPDYTNDNGGSSYDGGGSNDGGNDAQQGDGDVFDGGDDTTDPGDGGDGGDGGAGDGGDDGPDLPGTGDNGTNDVPDTGTGLDEPVEDLWTRAEALTACTNEVLSGVLNPLGLDLTTLLQSLGLMDDRNQCVDNRVGTPQ
jgi:hypothetical protein